MAAAYPQDTARHAWEVYRYLKTQPADSAAAHPLENPECFKKELKTFIKLRRSIAEQVYLSRAKDFSEPLRTVTYRNREEMEQVVGTAINDPFVMLVREQAKLEKERLEKLSRRL